MVWLLMSFSLVLIMVGLVELIMSGRVELVVSWLMMDLMLVMLLCLM